MQRAVPRLVEHGARRIGIAADDDICKRQIGVRQARTRIELDGFEEMLARILVDPFAIAAQQLLPAQEMQIGFDIGCSRGQAAPHHRAFDIGDQRRHDALRQHRLEGEDFVFGEVERLRPDASAQCRLGEHHAGAVVLVGGLDGAFGDIVGSEALGGCPDVLARVSGQRECRMARKHGNRLEVGERVGDFLDRPVEQRPGGGVGVVDTERQDGDHRFGPGNRHFGSRSRHCLVVGRMEDITSARNGADQHLRLVAYGFTGVVDGLGERVFGDDDPRPDCLEQFLLAQHPSGIARQEGEQLEGLWPDRHDLAVTPERTPVKIENRAADP